MSHRPKVIVLGAGIAGLVAAHELAERGLQVLVLEAASFAGGRTSSWTDKGGRATDTGLHVVADHYYNLLEVLGRLGANRRLQWHDQHLYLHPGRAPLHWQFAKAPAPFHLLRPFREMPIGPMKGFRLALASMGVARRSQAELAELDHLSYAHWHRRHRLGTGFLWELADAAADAATFLDAESASARAVLSWMKYMARNARAGDVALWRGTLEECLVRPLIDAIEARGGRVFPNTAVVRIEDDGHRATGVVVRPATMDGPFHRADGAVPVVPGSAEYRLEADFVVSAVPVQAFQRIVDASQAARMGLPRVHRLTTTPAMSLTVWFDRKITPMPLGAPLISGCSIRDLIDLAVLDREPADAAGSIIQFVVSSAHTRMHLSDGEIVGEVVRDLKRIWPAAAGAQGIDYALERIGAAMFAAVPGAHALRPTAHCALPNFAMAGSWTRQEHNASMEGAAVSGRLAANVVLDALGRGDHAPILTVTSRGPVEAPRRANPQALPDLAA